MRVLAQSLYAMTATRAFQFCLTYKRSTEFRRLCDILRNHLANLNKCAALGPLRMTVTLFDSQMAPLHAASMPALAHSQIHAGTCPARRLLPPVDLEQLQRSCSSQDLRGIVSFWDRYRDQRDRPDLTNPESLQLYLESRFEQLRVRALLPLLPQPIACMHHA
jgi:hypothetical protein